MRGASEFFVSDYDEARSRFLTAVANNRWRATQKALPVPGKTDASLFIDTALFEQTGNEKLVIISSGVHGPELFTGNAIQTHLLDHFIARQADSGVSFFFIHAVNPFGARHMRRVTEGNVDLNRNWLLNENEFTESPSKYRLFQDILEPTGKPGAPGWHMLKLLARLVRYLTVDGYRISDFTNGISSGQIFAPEGLFYGGRTYEPQKDLLQPMLKEVLQRYQQVLHFDIHTGLGDRGTLHLIPDGRFRALPEEKRKKMIPLDEHTLQVTHDSDDGFYGVTGDFPHYVAHACGNESVYGFTVEFGTLGSSLLARISSLSRLIQENQAHQRGASAANQKRIKTRFQEMFLPACPDWQSQVLHKGTHLIETAAQALTAAR